MGADEARGEVEVQLDHVADVEGRLDRRVVVVGQERDVGAADAQAGGAARPVGDPHGQAGRGGGRLLDGDAHESVDGVAGGDGDAQALRPLSGRPGARGELMDLQTLARRRGDEVVEAREGAHDVRRAAGAVEPAASAVRDRAALVGLRALAQLERVHVEVLGAGEGDPGQEGVEQEPFDGIGVDALAGGQQEPPCPLDRADGRAGLGVAAVGGHLVRVPERLPVPAGAHPAGDIGLGGQEVGEHGLAAGEQLRVAVLDRLVGGSGEEVEGAHGVALHGVGGAHRDVGGEVAGPGVGAGEPLVGAAHVEEEPGEVLDVRAVGEAVQLHERHLDHRMPAGGVAQIRPEDAAEVIDDPQGDGQQLLLAGAAGQGDRGLDQVPVAVELMVPGHVRVALLGGVAQRVHAVEIAVLLLGGGDPAGDLLGHPAQFGVVLAAELVGDRLEPLVDVRVLEDHAGRFALLRTADDAEVAERAGGLELLVPRAEPGGAVALLSGVPEAVGDAGVAGSEGSQGSARLRGRDSGGGELGGRSGHGGTSQDASLRKMRKLCFCDDNGTVASTRQPLAPTLPRSTGTSLEVT